MWSLTLLQICFLTFEVSFWNKQCYVMMKTQMVSQHCKRIKVQRYICSNRHAFNFESFLILLRHLKNAGHIPVATLKSDQMQMSFEMSTMARDLREGASMPFWTNDFWTSLGHSRPGTCAWSRLETRARPCGCSEQDNERTRDPGKDGERTRDPRTQLRFLQFQPETNITYCCSIVSVFCLKVWQFKTK